MTQIRNFAQDQQATLPDFQALAEDPRDLVDVLVATAIETGKAYAGGSVTKTSATKVLVDTPLYFYESGAIYSREDIGGVEIDLLSVLPNAGNKRVVAVVLSGQETEDDVEERDFLINAATEEVEGRPTATKIARRTLVNSVAGVAAPDPLKPVVDAALLVAAYVTLSSTEILTVEQVDDNRVTPLNAAVDRLEDVEDWRAATQPVIDGIKSDLSGLAGLAAGKADKRVISYLLETVARINERVGLGGDPALSRSDYFLDDADSDLTNLLYLAKVEEGLRFDDANKDTTSLALFTPADSSVIVHSSGLVLPKYTNVSMLSTLGKDLEVALSNAGAQTVNYKKRSVARTRKRWGQTLTRCTNSAWWQSGRYDPVTHIFKRDGDTFLVLNPDGALLRHKQLRLRQYWVDTYEETYWDEIRTTAAYNGNVAGQTFLNPRNCWLTAISLAFSRLDTSGDVRVLVTKLTASSTPDPENVIVDVLVPFAQLKVFNPANATTIAATKTQFSIPPVFLKGGDRYAMIITTPANHWLALITGNKFAQGSYFVSTDGAWFQGDISRDIAFELIAAKFDAPRLTVALDNWNLDGGLTTVDLSLEQIVPEGCSLDFEVKVSGTWYTVTEVGGEANHPLYGLPASIDARMVLVGTTDLMPGIHLATSKVTKSRSRTTFTHISVEQTTPVDVDQVYVIATLESYVEAHHNCAASLLTGVTFSTVVSPTATSDVTLPDGSIRRTWTFDSITPVDSFKTKIVGDTDSALSVFHVAEATFIAYPAP